MPYDDWSEALLGFRVTDRFGFSRNHYDRVVHLAFGVLMVWPLREILLRWLGTPRKFVAPVVLGVVTSCSCLYELLEWGIALLMSPDAAERYNGQQGDMWDAHKDMALAVAGAAVGLAVAATAGLLACRRKSEGAGGCRPLV